MKIVKSGILLVGKTVENADKFWRMDVVSENGKFGTQTETWHILKNGGESKHMISVPTWSIPTNVGRANERDAQSQALFEQQSETDKAIKNDGYWLADKARPKQERIRPMLAHSFDEHGDKMPFPCYSQPKIDGHRMLVNGTEGWGRRCNLHIPAVVKHLMFDTHGHILDGELMLPLELFVKPGMNGEEMEQAKALCFQRTASAVKKFYLDMSPKLHYYVFDIADPTKTNEERLQILKKLEKSFPPNVELVPTVLLKSRSEVQIAHDKFVETGYEGAMLRNPSSLYVSKRTANLQKVKIPQDAEFVVLGFEEGNGKLAGSLGAFWCAVNEDVAKKLLKELAAVKTDAEKKAILLSAQKRHEAFTVNPKCMDEQRQEYWDTREKLVGCDLTVTFQGKSEDNVPRFPRGKSVRDD